MFYHLIGYYASKSINTLMIDFKYNFSSNKLAIIDYNYNITANLIGNITSNGREDKEVWNKSFTLLETNSNSLYGKDFSITEKVDIDYAYYNNLARSYEETYGIIINSVLKLRLNVSYDINLSSLNKTNANIASYDTNSSASSNVQTSFLSSDNKETVTDYIELEIPITNTVTEVSRNYENLSKDVALLSDNHTLLKIIYIIMGILFILSSVIIILVKIKKEPKNIYKSNIRRIFKYYNDLIVTVKNKPDIGNLKIMEIAFFEDLIDVAEQSNSNIIYYEVSENEESNFYVIVNGYAYILVVKNSKLE